VENFDNESTFDILIVPLNEVLSKHAAEVDEAAGSKKLFFADFAKSLIFGFVICVGSLRKLVTELATNPAAKSLGLPAIKNSTLQEGFTRFPAEAFRMLFVCLLSTTAFMTVPEIQALGTLYLVDGSLFPVIKTIYWATYKKNQNAIKLHLAFELNRTLAVEFMVTDGNFNERSFVTSILKAGITYVMDRGYISFSLFEKIAKMKAFFVIRAKKNLQYTTVKILDIGPDMPKKMFTSIFDALVTLNNDSSGNTYRLVKFSIANTTFYLLTNRFELSTFQIILIYAYRWQIELMFRFLKRTMNGIHLFNNSENGIQIHFYALLITAMLQLKLKQDCVAAVEETQQQQQSEQTDQTKNQNQSPSCKHSFIKSLGQEFHKYWKLSCHWLITLKNMLSDPFNWKVVYLLGST